MSTSLNNTLHHPVKERLPESGAQTQQFLERYDLVTEPCVAPTSSLGILDLEFRLIKSRKISFKNDYMESLHYGLRANLDGFSSSWVSNPSKGFEKDGKAKFDIGKRVTDVFSLLTGLSRWSSKTWSTKEEGTYRQILLLLQMDSDLASANFWFLASMCHMWDTWPGAPRFQRTLSRRRRSKPSMTRRLLIRCVRLTSLCMLHNFS